MVYRKEAVRGPEQVLAYLSRYTHRVAISNSRLIAADDERHHVQLQRLPPRRARALQDHDGSPARVHQALPDPRPAKGFHRFGTTALANGTAPGTSRRPRTARNVAPCRRAPQEPPDIARTTPPAPPRPCPCCGGRMIVIETFARGCDAAIQTADANRDQDRYIMITIPSVPFPRSRSSLAGPRSGNDASRAGLTFDVTVAFNLFCACRDSRTGDRSVIRPNVVRPHARRRHFPHAAPSCANLHNARRSRHHRLPFPAGSFLEGFSAAGRWYLSRRGRSRRPKTCKISGLVHRSIRSDRRRDQQSLDRRRCQALPLTAEPAAKSTSGHPGPRPVQV